MTEVSVLPASARLQIVLRRTFVAFKHRNYRLWFIGQLVSVVGSWMQLAAQGYLIFEMTKSEAYLGYVGFANGLPSLLMLYAGVVADRFSRRAIMVVTQTSMMILALILAALTFLGVARPWHILLLSFGLGIANAFDAPARLALTPELVDREELTNAIALNATMFNLATVFGPAVGGFVYAIAGPGWCFTFNGITFIAVIVALLLMRLQPLPPVVNQVSRLNQLREGIQYTTKHMDIRILVAAAGITGLLGLSLSTLLPAWAVDVLGGNAVTNGWLTSARGAGSVIGALLLASLAHRGGKGKLLALSTFVFPVALLGFAFIHWLPLAMVMLAVMGLAIILMLNAANALVQSLVPEALRGRVMSIYSLVFFGAMPIGALLIGWGAQIIGNQMAVIVDALLTMVIAILVWFFVPRMRQMD